MSTISNYVYSNERITINELDVAAMLLDDAEKSRRMTVKYSALKAAPQVIADIATIAVIQQQLAEALQEGRLVVLPKAGDPS